MKPYSLDMRQKIVDTYEAGNRERVTFAISINAQKKQNSSFELLLSKIGENSNDVLISGE